MRLDDTGALAGVYLRELIVQGQQLGHSFSERWRLGVRVANDELGGELVADCDDRLPRLVTEHELERADDVSHVIQHHLVLWLSDVRPLSERCRDLLSMRHGIGSEQSPEGRDKRDGQQQGLWQHRSYSGQ